MKPKYPSALPQATSMGGYYNQMSQVQNTMTPQTKRKPVATTYQPNAIQNAIAFMRGGRK